MKKILIIDDSADFREMVKDMLEDADYEVSEASSAEKALSLCEREKFSLIICDLVLPVVEEPDSEPLEENDSVMVGVGAIQKLSTLYPSVPIIAVSGQMTGAPLKAMVKFGAISCLSKPFGRDELLRAVTAVLAQ